MAELYLVHIFICSLVQTVFDLYSGTRLACFKTTQTPVTTFKHTFLAQNSNRSKRRVRNRSKRVCKGWLVKAQPFLESKFIVLIKLSGLQMQTTLTNPEGTKSLLRQKIRA